MTKCGNTRHQYFLATLKFFPHGQETHVVLLMLLNNLWHVIHADESFINDNDKHEHGTQEQCNFKHCT